MLSDLAFHVLLALGDGPSHGYAIGKAIEEQSGGRLDPTTGALYQALRRLADDELIAEVGGPEGRRCPPALFRLDGLRVGAPLRRKRHGSTRWSARPESASSFRSARDADLSLAPAMAGPDAGARLRERDGRDAGRPPARGARRQLAAAPALLVPRAGDAGDAGVVGALRRGPQRPAPPATRIQPIQGGPHGHTRSGNPASRAAAVAEPAFTAATV